MAGRDHAPAAAERRDRRLQDFGDGLDLGSRAEGAATDHDERAAGVDQQVGGGGDGWRIGARRVDGDRRGQRDLGCLAPCVDGALERDRAGAAGNCQCNGLRDAVGCLLRGADAFAVFDDVSQQADLVVDLVQVAVALVNGERRYLASQRDHRCAHRAGQQKSGGGVKDAGSRDDGERLRFAGDQCGPKRHVCGGLLVPGVDDADAAPRLCARRRTGGRYGHRAAR